MSLIAICAAMFPDITILTFEIMNNHVHIVLYGTEEKARAFFAQFRTFLDRWLRKEGYSVDLSQFKCSLKAKEDASSIKNMITYTNRNGFLVHPETTPFNYPWGANCYFFNPDAKKRYDRESTRMTMTYRRKVTHSRKADRIKTLRMLDDYACPLSFCDIASAEEMFKNASNYFYELSRNIESHKSVADEIGEKVFYSDDELFRIVQKYCQEKHDVSAPSLLPPSAKVEVAKTMHYDYNASCKQIARILKIEVRLVNQLFPTPKN